MATRLRPEASRISPFEAGAPIHVCFLFVAQIHQVLHGAGTAIALARRPGFRVRILVASETHRTWIEALLPPGEARPEIVRIGSPLLHRLARWRGATVPPKLLTLSAAAREVAACDAVVVPERTSLLLRRMGVSKPRFIHIDHGAGDRAAGFDRRIRAFDFVLMAGEKQRRRMLREGLIHPGRYAIVGYPKFAAADAARGPRARLFADDKPIILYNPHFCPKLSSWPSFGVEIVRNILEDGRFNLIVAPHIRMAEGRRRKRTIVAALKGWIGHPDLHVDLDGPSLSDMTYTQQADIYLGDASSQVYEFLRLPRPCVFMNPRALQWHGDENFSHWRYGDVVTGPSLVVEALARARERHRWFRSAQEAGFFAAISETAIPAAERAAAAIERYCASEISGKADPAA